jgi:hypothetical protein
MIPGQNTFGKLYRKKLLLNKEFLISRRMHPDNNIQLNEADLKLVTVTKITIT